MFESSINPEAIASILFSFLRAFNCSEDHTMYPKLKVRSQDEDVGYVVGISPPLPGLKGLDSLFHGDFSSTVKMESKASSKKVETEVASSCNVGSVTHSSASKDKNDSGGEEEMRPHIRASLIPRPRAVLSSPINDDMIGSKCEKTIQGRTSILKPHDSGQKCRNYTKKLSAGGRSKSGQEVREGATIKSKSEIHQLGPKCEVRLKNSAAERLKSGRQAPEEAISKKNIRVNMKSGVKE